MTGPVPVHLICGFLGSGKTTLLRRILAEQPAQERLVVLVNEFGELGIDGELLQGFDSEVLELSSGCICCTLKADFVSSLSEVMERFAPQRVLVEATGIAEAGDLTGAIEQLAGQKDVALASLATVVDAEIFEHRDMLGDLYFNQIKAADLLLLNKTDLVPADQVEALSQALAEINPRARVLPTVHCAVERAIILAPLRSPEPGQAAQPAVGQLQGLDDLIQAPGGQKAAGQDHQGFVAFAFQNPGRLDPKCLERFLADLPWGVFRLKGFVRLPQGSTLLNYTYRRPEMSPVDDNGPTRLAFVAWGLEAQPILSRLEQCLLAD